MSPSTRGPAPHSAPNFASQHGTLHGPPRQAVAAMHRRERERFVAAHPRSAALARDCDAHFLFGVPLHWMCDWGTPFTLFAQEARGAHLRCVDGHDHVDLCLADTGSMFGHAPAAVVEAIRDRAAAGFGAMLPGEDTAAVGALLAERFGLPFWQMALSASDANRFCLRWARAATGRSRIVVFDGCYHGTVDETFVDIGPAGPQMRASLLGAPADLSATTRVVPFNDADALEAALADGSVACVITEPALTNIGMVLPRPGFLEQVRALCDRHGTLLLLDETHTISAGPGGWGRMHGIRPDLFVVGKPIAGGLPCAVYGFSEEAARRARAAKDAAAPGHSGIGTTLSGNLLAAAAVRATLEQVATPQAYARMHATTARLADGIEARIGAHGLPWCVSRIGARCEFQFRESPPDNGEQARAAMDHELEAALHLYLLNRGVLITPFHNMMLSCPQTTDADVDRTVALLDEAIGELFAAGAR